MLFAIVSGAFNLVSTHAAYAQNSQALSFSFDGGYDSGYNGTLGWTFTVNQNLTVTALGFYNAGLEVTSTHMVGIFDATGTLIASGSVGPSISDQVIQYFDYSAIAPISLTAGNSYTAAALLTSTDYFYYGPSSINTDSRISYELSGYQLLGGNSLQFPDSFNNANGYGYFGPNFLIAGSDPGQPAGTPEPGTALFAGAAITFIAGNKLRQRKHR